jgi:hypothetical protein
LELPAMTARAFTFTFTQHELSFLRRIIEMHITSNRYFIKQSAHRKDKRLAVLMRIDLSDYRAIQRKIGKPRN